MIILIAIGALILLLILTIIYAFIHYGSFEDVDVKTGPPPVNLNGKVVAYKLNRGPYSESGHLFTEVTGDLVRVNPAISSKILMIGFYYDNPQIVEDENQCRYAAGVLLPDVTQQSGKTESGDSLIVTEEIREQIKNGLVEKGYELVTLPSIDHVVHATFPFRGPFSIVIATRRVYPCLNWYVQEHNLCAHPSIEVYTSDSIHFILPLSKQDSFYFFPPDSEEGSEGESNANEEEEIVTNSEAEHEEEEEEEEEETVSSKDQGSSSSGERRKASSGSSSFEEIEIPSKK